MPQRVNTTGAVGTALDGSVVNWAWIIRLDIETDPLYAWTGFGDLVFGASQTGDSKLDGMTFQGITHLVMQVGAIQDKQGGSGALELSLPGVDLTDEAMRQVVYDARKWQWKTAYVWIALFDDNGALIGNPISVKRGRMDQMSIEENDSGEGTVRCTIEGQQAYSSQATASRYSEQSEIDATDNSQQHVWALANMSADLNKPAATGSTSSTETPGRSNKK